MIYIGMAQVQKVPVIVHVPGEINVVFLQYGNALLQILMIVELYLFHTADLRL